MESDLVTRVGQRAANRLLSFAQRARAMSPLPVIRILLFGSRARGDANAGSDWDVAVVVRNGGSSQAVRDARNIVADLALPDIASGFHLRPIVICSAENTADPDAWLVSQSLAHNVKADGLLIA